MSSRPQFNPFPVITNGDMTTTLVSIPTVIQKLSMLSYDVSWSGVSPVGNISLQVSNTYSQNEDGSVRNAGNWNTVPLTGTTAVSGNTGNGFVDVDAQGAYAVRLVYTPVSGTGSLNATVNGKVS